MSLTIKGAKTSVIDNSITSNFEILKTSDIEDDTKKLENDD